MTIHIFRKEDNSWIYKGDYNIETKENSGFSLKTTDKWSEDYPDYEWECEMMPEIGILI